MKIYKDNISEKMVRGKSVKNTDRQIADCNKDQLEIMKSAGWSILTGEDEDGVQVKHEQKESLEVVEFKLLTDSEFKALNEEDKKAYISARDAQDTDE